MTQEKITALKAWASAAWICLPTSLLVMGAWKLLERSPSEPIGSFGAQVEMFVLVTAIATVVHLIAYLAFGLPLFLRFYPRPHSRIWRWDIGILLGFLLGATAITLVYSLILGSPLDSNALFTALAGGIYGAATAIACLFKRPRS